MKNKKIILVLGSTGFVGSRLKKIFKENNCNIIVPTSSELNLKNKKKISYILQKNKITHIINCAGKVGGILDNTLNQIDYFRENLEINYNLISSSYEVGIKNFINLSSSCMYPSNLQTKMKEERLMSGKLEPTNFGYAIAKLTVANYIKLLRDKYNYNYCNIIPCNLYGPNDNFTKNKSHLIASIIQKVSFAKKNNIDLIEVWGDGTPKREFLYIDDLVSFIYDSIKKNYNLPSFLNIGFGKDYSVNYYYRKVMEMYDYKAKLTYNLNMPNGIKRKLLDINQAKIKFNFKPKTSIEKGLKSTIKYYENSL